MFKVTAARGENWNEVESTDIPALVAAGTPFWVDAQGPTADELHYLQSVLQLHPLAVEDVAAESQRPKLENYGSHVFLVAQASALGEVDIFFSPKWIVTVIEQPDPTHTPMNDVASRLSRLPPDGRTVGAVLYLTLDELVDDYFEVTDELELHVESLEDHIFSGTTKERQGLQAELFQVRRRILQLRRVVSPLREVLAALIRGDVEWVEPRVRVHLKDVEDHVLRALDQLQAARELTNNAVDAELSLSSNRMNQVMKTMTSWGALLLGATLIAGIYGMNFKNMPELDWRLGYPMALAMMATMTTIGYRLFNRNDWL